MKVQIFYKALKKYAQPNPTQPNWVGFYTCDGLEFLNLIKCSWVEKTLQPDPYTPLITLYTVLLLFFFLLFSMYSHITSLAFQFHYIIFLPISLKYNISYLKKKNHY